jgi:hypothetical protein
MRPCSSSIDDEHIGPIVNGGIKIGDGEVWDSLVDRVLLSKTCGNGK